MKLKDIKMINLLPVFMRNDKANIGLAAGVDEIVKMFADYADNMSTWAAIDNMTEAELDELAWELNISWYEQGANIAIKRKLIKESDEIQCKLGTKWAVEQIITTYFGTGDISEWFEYGGEAGHFRVESSNPSVTNENLDKFLRILNKVKRKSSQLDGIVINLAGEMPLHMGIAYHEASFELIRIGEAY